MSNHNGPVGRRRIAGEGKPAAPVQKAPNQKAPTQKAPRARRAPADKPAPAVTKAPTVRKAKAATPAAPATKPASRPAPAVRTRTAGTAAAPTKEPGSGPNRHDLLWLVPLTLVAAAALVVGVLVLVSGLKDDGGDGDVATARRQATSAAATAAETVFSYRYDELDQHLSASQALMTPAYGKKFAEFEPALAEIAPQGKFVLKSVTREAAALECGDECSRTKVNVLVFYDQARLANGSKQPTVFSNRATVSMVKRDGGWLVDDIRSLGN